MQGGSALSGSVLAPAGGDVVKLRRFDQISATSLSYKSLSSDSATHSGANLVFPF